MAIKGLLSGNPSRNAKLYIGIGLISLVKAVVVRNDRNRFRRELTDAAMFIGVGLALRQYSTLKAEKRREIESQVPDWAIDLATSEQAQRGVRSLAKQRLGRQPEPEPSLKDRAQRMLSSR
ncbi:hypothetical protein HT576_03635 [Haloterrigena sp. SYSU A121-1]|uniref:Uncharacterized protein n=1 Tax=Haloterrigena gelatinilytica TaxID=2741724 RepID=A0A8J8GI69_9EURY|nr:hypothetical protein [Haloterrigena gelatinilytica]NUB90126.1 hypothetical protein [Haloterrigena gelatinilytica]